MIVWRSWEGLRGRDAPESVWFRPPQINTARWANRHRKMTFRGDSSSRSVFYRHILQIEALGGRESWFVFLSVTRRWILLSKLDVGREKASQNYCVDRPSELRWDISSSDVRQLSLLLHQIITREQHIFLPQQGWKAMSWKWWIIELIRADGWVQYTVG